MESEPSLWNVEAVGKYLNVSKDTIYRWIDKKKMPAILAGKKWLFRKEAIDAWLNSAENREEHSC